MAENDTIQAVRDYFRSKGTVDYGKPGVRESLLEKFRKAAGPMGRAMIGRGIERVAKGLSFDLPIEEIDAFETFYNDPKLWKREVDWDPTSRQKFIGKDTLAAVLADLEKAEAGK